MPASWEKVWKIWDDDEYYPATGASIDSENAFSGEKSLLVSPGTSSSLTGFETNDLSDYDYFVVAIKNKKIMTSGNGAIIQFKSNSLHYNANFPYGCGGSSGSGGRGGRSTPAFPPRDYFQLYRFSLDDMHYCSSPTLHPTGNIESFYFVMPGGWIGAYFDTIYFYSIK